MDDVLHQEIRNKRRKSLQSAKVYSKSISSAKHSESLPNTVESSKSSDKKNLKKNRTEILEFINKSRNGKSAGLNTKMVKNTFYRYYDLERKKRLIGRDKDQIPKLTGYVGISKTIDKKIKKKSPKKESKLEDFERHKTLDERKIKRSGRYNENLFDENLFVKSKLLQKMEIKPSELLLNLDKCKSKIERKKYC